MEDDEITTLDDLATALNEPEGQAQDAPEGEEQQAEAVEPEATETEESEEEAEETEEEDEQAQASPEPTVVKLTLDGVETEVPISEIESGYMRQADYTRKTQQLAEERKQAAQQIARQMQQAQKVTRDMAHLISLHDQMQAFEKADWDALYKENPTEAGRLQARWQQMQSEVKTIQSSIQAQQQQQQAARREQVQRDTVEAMETLQRDIPGFSEKTIIAARDAAVAHGYTAAELDGLTDPRAIKVLWDAAQWRALQSGKPAVKNKVRAAPPKTTKGGHANVPKSKAQVAYKRMQSQRDVESLAGFLLATEK